MPRNKTPIPEDLLEMRRRLAEWRSSHPPRSRLPEELWSAAVELARQHGGHRTARILPVHYASLRSRMGETPRSRKTARPAEFVELLGWPQPAGGVVEMMRVQVNGVMDWSELLRAWRQAER